MTAFVLRPARQNDGAFLADMVVEAANVSAPVLRLRHEVLSSAEHHGYVAGWMRPGDAGLVAERLR